MSCTSKLGCAKDLTWKTSLIVLNTACMSGSSEFPVGRLLKAAALQTSETQDGRCHENLSLHKVKFELDAELD
jgi:hypothetical protein